MNKFKVLVPRGFEPSTSRMLSKRRAIRPFNSIQLSFLNPRDVALQPSMTRDLHLVDGDLGEGCDARCHGPSYLATEYMNTTQSVTVFDRSDPLFSR